MYTVNYWRCPICKTYYQEGEKHLCDSLNGRDEDRGIHGVYIKSFGPLIIPVPSNENSISDIEKDDDDNIRIPEKPPVAVYRLINSDEHIYALLERIAVALERLSGGEK